MMGDIHYFLGIAASRLSSGLFLSQTNKVCSGSVEESCHALLQAHEHPVIYWHEAFTGLWYAVFLLLFLSKPCWRIAVSHSRAVLPYAERVRGRYWFSRWS